MLEFILGEWLCWDEGCFSDECVGFHTFLITFEDADFDHIGNCTNSILDMICGLVCVVETVNQFVSTGLSILFKLGCGQFHAIFSLSHRN